MQSHITLKIRLFVKSYCGWCDRAAQWLDARDIEYEVVNVSRNDAAYDEMIKISGQDLAPVIDVNGKVLADFGPEELSAFWEKNFGGA